MELSKEYMLSQYQELGILNGNNSVRLVRHSITGRIAVKKCMKIEQKPVYEFLMVHKNKYIPQIYGYFENGDQMIVIEEYIEGRNLEDILCEQRMPVEEGVRIVKDICRGMSPLHTASPPIICRDLKPENIMLTLQGHVKLIDFDIARIVSPGKSRDTVIMGTEGFAPPEQFGRRQTDGRSDIYALGTILNYIVLKKFPVEEIVPGKLGEIIRRCIALNPDERYQSVKELEGELEALYPGRNKYEAEGNGLSAGELPGWRRFLPPGFRSGRVWKMILAVMGYLLVFYICLDMDVSENGVIITGIRAISQNILVLLAQLAEIAVIFNYLGCRDRMPLLKLDNRLIRIAGYAVLELVFMVIAVLIWMLLDLFI